MRTAYLVVPILALAACGGGGSDTTGPDNGPPAGGGGGAANAVEMKGNVFMPATVRVAAGATVNFTNSDGYNHDVNFASTAIPDIAAFSTGAKSATMPATLGTYAYTCNLHSGMSGTVVVQ